MCQCFMNNYFNFFKALLSNFFNKVIHRLNKNRALLIGDRRNRPLSLKPHSTKEKSIASLNNVINEQVQSAQEKMTNAYMG